MILLKNDYSSKNCIYPEYVWNKKSVSVITIESRYDGELTIWLLSNQMTKARENKCIFRLNVLLKDAAKEAKVEIKRIVYF